MHDTAISTCALVVLSLLVTSPIKRQVIEQWGKGQTLRTLTVPCRPSRKNAVGFCMTDIHNLFGTSILLLTPHRSGNSRFRQDGDGNPVYKLPTEAVYGLKNRVV